MIDIREIEMEIEKLEQEDTTYQNCSKLAVLYSIKDHFKKDATKASYSYGQSEFLQACSNASIDNVLSVMDEHMEAIKLLYPKEYSAIINRIVNL